MRTRRRLPMILLAALSAAVALPGASAPAAEPVATIVVNSAGDAGPGSLRDAIVAANESSAATRISIELKAGSVIWVKSALPALSARGLDLAGGGATLRSTKTCVRADGRPGCDGLVVSGPSVTIRDLRVEGFLFDGIAVRGPGATGARILRCECFDNFDDGVGISDRATGALVSDCVLNGNGFRKKGKGILVYDYAQALLRNNLVSANRDGITVSRYARATLENNLVLYNYDKGVGAAAGWIDGFGNRISGNGAGGAESGPTDGAEGDAAAGNAPPPNRDGLRVTLDSSVFLKDTVIAGNGDAGVVVLDSSRVVLAGGSVSDNGGDGAVAGGSAYLQLREVAVSGNGGAAYQVLGPQAHLEH